MGERVFGVSIEDDVKLNKYALDEESEMTPSILHHWSELYAEARAEVSKAEYFLKAKRAERELYFRRNPPADIKTTEAVFSALLETDKEVQEATEEVVSWQEKCNRYYAVVDALHDKSNRLHDLVDLWEKGYYSNRS